MDQHIDISDRAMEAEASITPREFDFTELIDLTILQPGDIVNIGDGTSLAEFESAMVDAFLPSTHRDGLKRWQTRSRLLDDLRPKGFYGRLTDLKALILDQPYDQLIAKYPNHYRGFDANLETIGFRLFANLHSTGRGCIGSIDTRVWIFRRDSAAAINNYGKYGRKIEQGPKINQSVEDAIAEARRTGSLALKWAIEHAMPTPFGTGKRR